MQFVLAIVHVNMLLYASSSSDRFRGLIDSFCEEIDLRNKVVYCPVGRWKAINSSLLVHGGYSDILPGKLETNH